MIINQGYFIFIVHFKIGLTGNLIFTRYHFEGVTFYIKCGESAEMRVCRWRILSTRYREEILSPSFKADTLNPIHYQEISRVETKADRKKSKLLYRLPQMFNNVL